jgi:hypothetical protein
MSNTEPNQPPVVSSRSALWRFVEHPRTNLIAGLIVGGIGLVAPKGVAAYLLWFVAGFLVLRSVWEAQWFQRRFPYRFQAPMVRKEPVVRVAPPPAAMGNLDFSLYMQRSSQTIAGLLGKMSKEMQRNTGEVGRNTARIVRANASGSIERQHRAAAKTAAGLSGHAKRLGRLEAEYRLQVESFVTNSQALIGAIDAPELPGVAANTTEFRASIESGKAGTSSYRDSVQTTRQLNMSQAVNGASENLMAVLGRVMEDADTLIAYCDWVADYVRENA